MSTNRSIAHPARLRRRVRRLVGLLGVVSLGAFALVAPVTSPAGASTRTLPSATPVWSYTLNDRGYPIAGSSPMVATLDGGGPAVLVGDRAGNVYAFHLSNGSPVAGWPVSTHGIPIDSTPSVLGSGTGAVVYVGVGNSSRPADGFYYAINANGTKRWTYHPRAGPGPSPGYVGLQSSITIGVLQTGRDVISGTMAQEEYAFNSSNGAVLTGFPWFEADSNFATPAVADLSHVGHDAIIEGGDSTAGNAFGYQYANGGHLRILSRLGNHGSASPAGGLFCQYNTNQVVQSSPAVGGFLLNAAPGIVFGTGTWYAGASDTNKLLAVDPSCRLRWRASLDGATSSSPALADSTGDGRLKVIEGTRTSPTTGTVWALDGHTGHPFWTRGGLGAIYGGATTVDLGAGYQDVIVPTTSGVYVLDGRNGQILSHLGNGFGFQNTALVTVDPGGQIGITIAGYNGLNQGVIAHYRVPRVVASVSGPGKWPMFHHDPKLTGYTG